MKEVLRTNDPVLLSFAKAVLDEAGYGPVIADNHMSIMDGSIAAIPRRLMVASEDHGAAQAELDRALAEVEARTAEPDEE